MKAKSLKAIIKQCEPFAYEVKCGALDFMIRKERTVWCLDVYRSRIKNSDEAHIGTTIECASLSEAIGECVTLAMDERAGLEIR